MMFCIERSKNRCLQETDIIGLCSDTILFFTQRASCGAVYCNRPCLCVGLWLCLWACYHDNSKLRASILTKLGL